MTTDEELVDAFFLRRVKKGGAPDLEALQKFAKSKGLSIPIQDLREWRRRFKSTAKFERVKSKPPGYMTNQHPRYGQVMIDLAFFMEKWRKFNGGAKGKLLEIIFSPNNQCSLCYSPFRISLGG